MTDWRAIARAHGLEISATDLDRIAVPLTALEGVFRPLVKDLLPGQEPDTELRLCEDDQ